MNDLTLDEYPPDDVQLQAFAYRYLNWAASIGAFFKTVDNWKRRHATRRRAEAVSTRVLRDIGISEAQRFIEVNKHFWEQ
jgi:uncharacterized protein YjiS (DUF1127 family)